MSPQGAAQGEPLVLAEQVGAVGRITLNRPAVRNALSYQLMLELVQAAQAFERTAGVGALVLTGAGGVFAAGADIAEMRDAGPVELMAEDRLAAWQRLRALRKPIVAAVEGLALGGGFELAMLCDMIVVGDGARFGQPEIRLGVMPGAGGTQLLTRALGKWRAMELVLTARTLSGREIYEAGLATRAVPDGQALAEAMRLAQEVAAMPPVAVRLAKEAVAHAFMAGMEEGLRLERKNFYLLFATQDRSEGMRAFLEKRSPRWQGK